MATGGGVPGQHALGEQLGELKRRSGRSYAALAHRTGLSRSTLHRYCAGGSVPPAFGAVERIARVCGASDEDVDRLYRAWRQATAEPERESGREAEQGREQRERERGAGSAADEAAAAAGEGTGEGRTRPPATAARTALAEAAAGTADTVPAGAPPADTGTTDTAPACAGTTAAGTGDAGAAHAAHDPSAAPAGGSVLTRSLRLRFVLRVAVLLLVSVLTSLSTAYPYVVPQGDTPHPRPVEHERPPDRPGDQPPSGGEQLIKGPDWSVTPTRVPSTFLGLTVNTDTGRMPGFRTGAVRLWDSETRWGTLQPERGRYDWTNADRMVSAAERRGLPVLFTLSGTPLWAGPEDAARGSYADALAAPPEDLADWDDFVREVAERYEGRVESYELWDYPGHPQHFSGSVRTLAEMVERASRIIRRADPEALVACPSFGGLWTRKGQELLREFAETGAYEHCDAAALKLPPRRADGPPEQMIEITDRVYALFYKEGIAIPFWNTGTDRDIVVRPPLDARRARAYAVRFYLSGLYAGNYGLRRMYFYNWGSTRVPLVVQPVGGRPTAAGVRMGRLAAWLDGARIAGCGKGEQMGLVKGAYTCRFVRDGRPADVFWTTGEQTRMTLDHDVRRLHHVDGRSRTAHAGDQVSIGPDPLFVEYR